MTKIIIIAICFVWVATVWGQSKSKLTFEPLYGVETALVRYPEPSRYVTRAVYGARLLYGVTLLSAELEGTKSHSRKDYPDSNLVVSDEIQRVNLGLRSTYSMASFLGFYFRAGGSASQGKTILKENGIERTENLPLAINPYAGAGLQLAFHQFIALNAGVTMIRNREDKYDAQYTLGLSARLGN